MTAVRLARAATGRDRRREVRGLLPRPQRRPPGRRGERRGHLGAAGLGRRAPQRRVGHDRGALQRGPCHRRLGRVRDRRAGGGQHGARGSGRGLPRGAARRLRPRRRPPHLRRGDHGLSGRARRCHRRARGAPGPVVLRQGDRGRPAPCRSRRPARPHVAAGPSRARLPGGHVVGQSCGDGGRSRRARAPRRGGLREAGRECGAARRRARAAIGAERACGAGPLLSDPALGLLLRGTGAGLPGRGPVSAPPGSTPRSSGPCSHVVSPLPRARTRSPSRPWPTRPRTSTERSRRRPRRPRRWPPEGRPQRAGT